MRSTDHKKNSNSNSNFKFQIFRTFLCLVRAVQNSNLNSNFGTTSLVTICFDTYKITMNHVSDSEDDRLDAWDLENEQRWAGPDWTVTPTDFHCDHPYEYKHKDASEPTYERPDMHESYDPVPKPGEHDQASPLDNIAATPASQAVNVIEQYCNVIKTYGSYHVSGSLAAILKCQRKVTSIEARVFAERTSVASDREWKNELKVLNGERRDGVYLDDFGPCALDKYRADGDGSDPRYDGWLDKVPDDRVTAERYLLAKQTVLGVEGRAPWPLLALTADLYDQLRTQRNAYSRAVTARKWGHVEMFREKLGVTEALAMCKLHYSDDTFAASPWFKEYEMVSALDTAEERYKCSLRTGLQSTEDVRVQLSSRSDQCVMLARKICFDEMGLAAQDPAWIARIEAELASLNGRKRSAPSAPRQKKKTRLGGGAMQCITGSNRVVEKSVAEKRRAPDYRQVPDNGVVPFRTNTVCVNPVGERECVLEAVRFALASNRLTRKSLELPKTGDVDFREVVRRVNDNKDLPFELSKSAPCSWSMLLTKSPGIYLFRVLLKDGESHYMVLDTWRMLLFTGGAAPAPAVDPLDHVLFYDGIRPEDADTDIGRLFFVEDDEIAHPDKFEEWVKKTIDVASAGVDNMYRVDVVAKRARQTAYNTPQHFDR